MYPVPVPDSASGAHQPGGGLPAGATVYAHLVEDASECDQPRPVQAAMDAADAVKRRLDAFDAHTLPLLERLRARGTEIIEVPLAETCEQTWEAIERAVLGPESSASDA